MENEGKDRTRIIQTIFVRLKHDITLEPDLLQRLQKGELVSYAQLSALGYIESTFVDLDPLQDHSQNEIISQEISREIQKADFEEWWSDVSRLSAEKRQKESGEVIPVAAHPLQRDTIIRFLPAEAQLKKTPNSVEYGAASIRWSGGHLIYEAGKFVFSGDIFYHPDFREFETRIIREKLPLQITAYDEACQLAKDLSSKYAVPVGVVDNDQQFFSDKSIKKSVQDDTYFVSVESPKETAKISEHLIRFQQLKFRLMIDAATAKRVEQSTATSQALGKTIDTIKDELLAAKKKPTLSRIAEILTERGVASPRGKQSKWHAETVKRILERIPNDTPDGENQTR